MDQREIFSNYKYATKVPQVRAPNDGKDSCIARLDADTLRS